VDPGIDHMLAMQCFNDVKIRSGKVIHHTCSLLVKIRLNSVIITLILIIVYSSSSSSSSSRPSRRLVELIVVIVVGLVVVFVAAVNNLLSCHALLLHFKKIDYIYDEIL